MSEILSLPNRLSSVDRIRIYGGIKAGKPVHSSLSPIGEYEQEELLLWDKDQEVKQILTQRFSKYGIDYGDIVILYPSFPAKDSDIILILRDSHYEVIILTDFDISTDHFIGMITRVIKFFRAPLDQRKAVKSHRNFKFSKQQIIDFSLTDCLLQKKKKDYLMIKVSGDSMIGVNILEGDIVVVNRNLEYYGGDVVAANSGKGYMVKTLRFDMNNESEPEAILVSENKKYAPEKIYLNKIYSSSPTSNSLSIDFKREIHTLNNKLNFHFDFFGNDFINHLHRFYYCKVKNLTNFLPKCFC